MRIFVFNFRRLLIFLIIFAMAALLISVVSIKGMEALGVFSSNRELPIYSVGTEEKVASITFDCAWGADDIPDILDTLKAADVKATFFIVGEWAEKYPDAVRRIAQEGHDVANHSYSHFRMGSLDQPKISSEIKQCTDILERLSGTTCDLFRAPYGDYSDSLLLEAKRQGYFTIQWDVDSLDWKPGISKEEILQRINTKIKPGSIILFHNDTAHTARLLPGIIAELKSKGYGFLPVSRLILRKDYFIDDEGRQKSNT